MMHRPNESVVLGAKWLKSLEPILRSHKARRGVEFAWVGIASLSQTCRGTGNGEEVGGVATLFDF